MLNPRKLRAFNRLWNKGKVLGGEESISRVDVRGGVRVFKLAQPSVGNPLNAITLQNFYQNFNHFRGNEAIGLVIINSTSTDLFSYGIDQFNSRMIRDINLFKRAHQSRPEPKKALMKRLYGVGRDRFSQPVKMNKREMAAALKALPPTLTMYNGIVHHTAYSLFSFSKVSPSSFPFPPSLLNSPSPLLSASPSLFPVKFKFASDTTRFYFGDLSKGQFPVGGGLAYRFERVCLGVSRPLHFPLLHLHSLTASLPLLLLQLSRYLAISERPLDGFEMLSLGLVDQIMGPKADDFLVTTLEHMRPPRDLYDNTSPLPALMF